MHCMEMDGMHFHADLFALSNSIYKDALLRLLFYTLPLCVIKRREIVISNLNILE